ncbi:MAG TPA: hypothetical protein VHB25_17420 [Gemmatimonadaceae bacterium]|nr:hypothetical protein [Gemmatimonadaceae bacterium]
MRVRFAGIAPIGLLVGILAVAGCAAHRGETGPWPTRIPPAPAIRFAEPISPRELSILVLDGNSGAPIYSSAVSIPDPGIFGTTDSAGIIRFRLPHAGQYGLRIRHIGFENWNGVASVTDSTGLALVVQLRRSYAPLNLTPVVAGTEPAAKPPHTR